MRIIFMGSPLFSVAALTKLIEAGHEVIAVYCQPPRAKDRGHTVQKGAVHLAAEALVLKAYTPKSLKSEEEQALFKSHNADVAVVAAYGLILPKAILEAPKLGCINIHASLLPRWRGAAPIHRAILEGDKETGITIMQMDEGLDTGDILSMQSLPITQATTTPILHDQLSALGADLIVSTLENLSAISPTPQPTQGVTYAHKLVKSEGYLDWNLPAVELKRKIAALNPWPGTWFEHKDIPIKVLEASVVNVTGKPGEFLQTPEHPWIIC
ncbi:MAG: methionyl-tRNA formyltransferase, partial [Alphaproteobacteria bacterium]|nr:methionyl-tRNA formyltransferase [Alphaproteobacteria bacterium]